jgi:hypothetical protein
MDMDYGRFTGHPADPRTPEVPAYAIEQAADHALATPFHWASFIAESITEYDSAQVQAHRIKPEDVCDQDTATLLVLAIVGTNEQAAAARMYLQEAFCEHHSELIDQLATDCDDAHCDGPDEWEAA